VDDTIFTAPYAGLLKKEIRLLGVASDECDHFFQLTDEGEVGYFLGIRIKKQKDNSLNLQQVLPTTPAETTSVGADIDGEAFNETLEYALVVGILMYITSNARPVIVYAVHQSAR
jgi:hypothetical protein